MLVDRSNPSPESDDDEGDECVEYDACTAGSSSSPTPTLCVASIVSGCRCTIWSRGRRLEGSCSEVGREAEEGQQCSDCWKNTRTFARVVGMLVGSVAIVVQGPVLTSPRVPWDKLELIDVSPLRTPPVGQQCSNSVLTVF